ncbi:MAG: hemerythrin domain-containing protein [Acidimicrobiia bacterium]|nr:hemerythrin domain-containing protein [Acidimicrobiia bacterium]
MAAATTDVVNLILDDHRRFEALFAELRDTTSDRAAVRAELADLLVAHAEAEEEAVYPQLEAKNASTKHDVAHGEREHSQGNAALLVLLEIEDSSSDEFEDALEALFEAITHHVNEEELTLLNDARTSLRARDRATIGRAFAAARKRRLKGHPGAVEHVREIQNRVGLGELDTASLRFLAAARGIEGRATMTKQQLLQTLAG